MVIIIKNIAKQTFFDRHGFFVMMGTKTFRIAGNDGSTYPRLHSTTQLPLAYIYVYLLINSGQTRECQITPEGNLEIRFEFYLVFSQVKCQYSKQIEKYSPNFNNQRN